MWTRSQPVVLGLPENPYPGRDGITTWNASSALPPKAVGSVSGPTRLSSSMTDPGQPCVMISGRAPSWFDLTWMKWMSRPSISVMNCGRAFSLSSTLPKS